MRTLLFLIILKISLISNEIGAVSTIAEKSTFRVLVIKSNRIIGTGSGFFVNKDGYFITNNHVADGTSKIAIVNKFGKYNDVEMIKTYPKKDLAILKIKNYDKKKYLKLQKPKTIEVGHKVFTFGYPGVADMVGSSDSTTATLNDGIVSKFAEISTSRLRYEIGLKVIQTNAAINSGNSGGPLLSRAGSVLGVNTFKPSANTEGTFFSIHVSEVIKILKENNIKYDISTDSMEDGGFNIAYLIFAIAFLALVAFIIKNKKNNDNGIDKGEISQLIRDKMNKYGKNNKRTPIKQSRVKQSSLNPKKQPTKKKKIINTKLIPQDKTHAIIEAKDKDLMTLGRNNTNDIIINNQHVSGNHLSITILGTKITIIDLDSSNGTYIDGNKLQPHQKTRLLKNQKLIIGSEDVVYNIGS